MSSVSTTQSLLGQPPEVVQSHLGPSLHQQSNPEKQTDFEVYRTHYLQGVFPVQLSGIIGIYRKNRCIGFRIILSKSDPNYSSFVYNREIATRLFERLISNDYAYWSEIEAEPKSNTTTHYVYCMGGNVATTWDGSTSDGTLTSDVMLYLDNRCGETDHSVVSQPIAPTVKPGSPDQGSPIAPGPLGKTGQGTGKPGEIFTFSDIDGNRYEADILKAANTYRLMTGYEDASFHPEMVVSREQGVVLLMRAMQQRVVDQGAIALPDELETAPFADVPADHRSAQAFYFAKKAGILTGDGENKAYPDSPLTRATLMAIVHSGLQFAVQANYSPSTDLSDVIEPAPTQSTFSDIAGHWGEGIIQTLATYGIATPLNEAGTEFHPDTSAQRDYTAAVLVRLLELHFRALPGLETRPNPVKTFPDIGNDPYKEAIIKAANQYGIVSGYQDGKFHPTDYLSREQAVTMVINTLQEGVQDPDVVTIPETLSDPPPFPDVTAGDNATKIQFAKEIGLVSGDKNGLFRPMDRLSRAQLIAMVHNGLEFLVHSNLSEDVSLAEALQNLDTPPVQFSDIPANHWARGILDDLAKTGIVTPYGETGTEFKPDAPAQRNYAAAAMVRMLETPLRPGSSKPGQKDSFSDITGNPFEQEILQAANQYKLVAGYEDGTFKPTSPVSREQAVVMLVDALQQRIVNKDAIAIPDHLTQPPFLDVDINRWSAQRLYFAKQTGLIAGDKNGRFYPDAQLGRAQLMAITYQALSYALWADFGGKHDPINQMFVVPSEGMYSFDDLPEDHWARGIVATMGQLGLALPLDPAEPTQFSPDTLAYRDYTVATAVHMIQLDYTQAPTPVANIRFMDIASSPYADEIQNAANQYHIISGAEDGNFHPLESMHREHVVAMVVDVLKLMVEDKAVINVPDRLTQAPFRDVPADSVFAPKIKFVADVGIMGGDQARGLFRPKNDLTRAELMAIASNALDFVVRHNYGEEATLESVVDSQKTKSLTFSDIDDHWGQAAIERMATLGIALPRDPGSSQFLPNEPSRRDFAVASMVHLLEVPFQESEGAASPEGNQ